MALSVIFRDGRISRLVSGMHKRRILDVRFRSTRVSVRSSGV